MAENYSLLFLPDQIVESIPYQTDGRGPALTIPDRDRQTHGNTLLQKFQKIWQEAEENKNDRLAVSQQVKDGTYIEFKSALDADLVTKSLEDLRQKVRILNIREETVEGKVQTFATVFVPKGKEDFFLKKIRQYLDSEKDNESGKPKNADLVNSIEDIRLAVLESFWTDPKNLLPTDNVAKLCELWVKVNPRQEDITLTNLRSTCELYDIELFDRLLIFPERLVVLIKANKQQLLELIESSPDIAEIRSAKETAQFWVRQPNIEQIQWTEDLLKRIKLVDTKTGVCILDTGVNNGHPLISPVLSDQDCSAFVSTWGSSDHDGHGTLMAGVVAYGSLEEALETSSEIELSHRLSSVKILPPQGANDPDLYGAITQQAISIAEIQAPERKHVFCCAITSSTIDHKGKPTSWSGAIDAITSGQIDGERRLYVVSAGNVRNSIDWNAYPDVNLIRSIEDPAQSWNALTVGAFTEKVTFRDQGLAGHMALAPLRGLSPFSTSSFEWEGKWPIKPEIVLEGGNIRKAPDGTLYEDSPDLSILTTSHEPIKKQFDTIFATSAATAKAAWIAAKIQAQYPTMWPETVKGLMVHSAEWPDAIIQQYKLDTKKKGDVLKLMRICGYGVPDIDRALYCTSSVLTMVAEEYLQPFKINTPKTPKDSKRAVANDMHVYELPWPKDLLLNMGETQVKLRITLSYFIEPGPGEIGWKDKYRYASHAYRFDVNNTNEQKSDFIKRLNLASREENEVITTKSGSERWLIGSDNRAIGAICSDIWEGNAADIATCNMIGIYPVIGWWKERKHLGMVEKAGRYSLIVSLITPAQGIDIYTPIINTINTPVEVPVGRRGTQNG